MIRFEQFKQMDIDELAVWLDKYGSYDNSPWLNDFNEKYCSQCDTIMCKYPDSNVELYISWCETEGYCKYFPELDNIPDGEQTAKMWLESEGVI